MRLTSEEAKILYRQRSARAAGPVDCASEGMLVDAAAGQLPLPEREKLADHLAVCSDCAGEYRLLLELKPWAERAAEGLRTEEKAQAAVARTEAKRPILACPILAWWTRHSAPRSGLIAAVALLIVSSLAAGYWIFLLKKNNTALEDQLFARQVRVEKPEAMQQDLQRRLEEARQQVQSQQAELGELRRAIDGMTRPRGNVPIIDLELDPIRGTEGRPAGSAISIPANAELFTLILHPSGESSFAEYELEILDRQARQVARIPGLRKTPADAFNLILSRRLLPAGQYRLRLLGLRAGKSDLVGEFAIRVLSR